MFELNLKNLDLKNLDLKKLKTEVAKIANYETLKKEFNKLTQEISQLKLYDKLSPQNQQRIKDLETHFQGLLTNVLKAQQNFEKEINESVSRFKKTRSEVTETLENLKKRALDHKENIKDTIQSRIIKTTDKKPAKKTRIRKAKKPTTKM